MANAAKRSITICQSASFQESFTVTDAVSGERSG